MILKRSEDLYKNANVIPVSWGYGMNSSKESSEIIILSPNLDFEKLI